MRRRSLALALALLAASPFTAGVDARLRPAAPDGSASMAAAIADLTNAQRKRRGLRPLRVNAALTRAAQMQAEQMARLGRLDHELPEAGYPTVRQRLAAVAYDWQAYGENLARAQRTAAEVVEAWMQSPGHRRNLLSERFSELGIGYAVGADGQPYYAQLFAQPLR